jgi:uncharacterized membrane protein (DUF2068 family)
MTVLALGPKGAQTRLTSKLKVKRRDGLLLASFYAVVGVAELAILAFTNFALFTSGILAVLSFIAAYGLFTVKKWSPWLVIALFFPQFVFGVVSLYASILTYTLYQEIAFMLLNIALGAFILLSVISFVYVAAKRKSFQEAQP